MTSLNQLRARIDDLDQQIIQLLGERAACVQEVGALKSSDDEIVATERQNQVYQTRRAWARQAGLDPEFVESLYRMIIDHFIQQQRQQLSQRQNKASEAE